MTLAVICGLIFLSLVVSVYLIVVTLQRCRSEKRYNFIYCLVAIFWYNLGYFLEMTSRTVGGGVIAVKIMYAGSCFMPAFLFFFVADYCELKLKKRFYKIPLLLFSSLNYMLVATFDHHSLIYTSYRYEPSNPLLGIQIEPGPLYPVTTVYSLVCIVFTCWILIRTMVKTPLLRAPLVLLLAASLAPLFAQLAYVFVSFVISKERLSGINFTAFVMVISNAMLYFTILKNDLFDLAPKAYSITLDLIRDAFVVLDKDMNYSSSNKNARLLFPGLDHFPKGGHITKLENWPAELSTPDEGEISGTAVVKEKQFTLPQCPGSSYSGWINAVSSADEEKNKSIAGWVVLIQDITETVRLINSIQAQRDEIAAMRDNLKEGLFLMNKNCVIQPSYSRALEDVLSLKNIQGKNFISLLELSFAQKDLETIKDYFDMIFGGAQDEELLEDINPLQEFEYVSAESKEHKTLRGLFAAVDRGGGEIFILGTFQDITAEVKLHKRLAEEEAGRQDEMRSIFELLRVERQVFNNFIEDTDEEFRRINEVLKDNKLPPKELVVSMYQTVHAIKSNALIVGLASFAEKFHRLESEIKEIRERETIGFDDILHITMELDKRMKDKDKFLDLLKRIRAFSEGNTGETKTEKDVFLEAASRACARTAEDLGKKARFTAEAFDAQALVHCPRRILREIVVQLVRNAVSHGIETPEERAAQGKDETGTVSLSAAVENGTVRLVLQDDGRGLDFSRIAEKAMAGGLITKPETNDRAKLLNVLFAPGFSTAEQETIHSGRGIGLNLVRDRLRELKGNVRLRNEPGKGLAFDITIPA
jgi:two-component system chemotaxis sensor kinase CheA